MKSKTETFTDCIRRIARGHWAEDETLQRCHFPIGPRNTWSTLAYVACGVGVIDRYPLEQGIVMGTSLIMLGIGSGLYHGLKYKWANNLDWLGMYMCVTTLALNGLIPNAKGFLLGGFAVAGVFVGLFALAEHFDIHMGIGVVLASIRAVWSEPLLVVAALVVFAVAYGCWKLDKAKKMGLWGHALWHVLTAVAMTVLFEAQMQWSVQNA